MAAAPADWKFRCRWCRGTLSQGSRGGGLGLRGLMELLLGTLFEGGENAVAPLLSLLSIEVEEELASLAELRS